MNDEDRELLESLNVKLDELLALLRWAKPQLERFTKNPLLRLGGRS